MTQKDIVVFCSCCGSRITFTGNADEFVATAVTRGFVWELKAQPVEEPAEQSIGSKNYYRKELNRKRRARAKAKDNHFG